MTVHWLGTEAALRALRLEKAIMSAMTQKRKGTKRKIKIFGDMKQSLREALDYERGKKNASRISELPLPQKPLSF
jgi:hypothetical protein